MVKKNGEYKMNYHKERSFASNCFIFFLILFQFKNLLKSWFDVPTNNMPIFVFFAGSLLVCFLLAGFYIWRCLWSSTLYVHCSGHCLNLAIARSSCLINLQNSFVYSIPPVVASGINERSVRINSCKQRPF